MNLKQTLGTTLLFSNEPVTSTTEDEDLQKHVEIVFTPNIVEAKQFITWFGNYKHLRSYNQNKTLGVV